MNWKWISSSHPISDIRDWSAGQRLEIRPDFQRKEVWSPAAKILLIDTILRNIPMPKIFLQAIIRNTDTYRVVIDGQQRIKAILSFLRDEFSLVKPYTGEFSNLTFEKLPSNIQEDFLSYKVDINEIRNASDDIVRDIYLRVNKYTVALNKQELRRADFPGEFLSLSEDLAKEPFFEKGRIFTIANSKRMGDIEFVSELLALLLEGPQEKRNTLDDFYLKYMEWDSEEKDSLRNRFLTVLGDCEKIFDSTDATDDIDLAATRFKQKADFYSLFAAIDDCHAKGGSLENKPLNYLGEDFKTIDYNTAPQSEVSKFSEYAVKCVSQGNSLASRKWRRDFLKYFLVGTYFQKPPTSDGIEIFRGILNDLHDPIICPPYQQPCPTCDVEIADYSKENAFLTWSKSEQVFQLSNATFIHNKCRDSAHVDFFTWQDPGTLDVPFQS